MKLISINIEERNHLDKLEFFFSKEKPDVVCMQEICERDVGFLKSALNLNVEYTPMFKSKDSKSTVGIAIFANNINECEIYWLGGASENELQYVDVTSRYSYYETSQIKFLVTKVMFNNVDFIVGTVHLPATHKGVVTDYQIDSVNKLIDEAKRYEDLLLCGDFNAPRGGDIFQKVSKHYEDNIPDKYTSSLDPDLHRAGKLQRMVDGLFSTKNYTVSDVSLKSGVSDHLAVCAEIDQ